jgi:hypothetical protein
VQQQHGKETSFTQSHNPGYREGAEVEWQGRGTMSAASAIYFLNLRGDVILYRLYRDDAIGCVHRLIRVLGSPVPWPLICSADAAW